MLQAGWFSHDTYDECITEEIDECPFDSYPQCTTTARDSCDRYFDDLDNTDKLSNGDEYEVGYSIKGGYIKIRSKSNYRITKFFAKCSLPIDPNAQTALVRGAIKPGHSIELEINSADDCKQIWVTAYGIEQS